MRKNNGVLPGGIPPASAKGLLAASGSSLRTSSIGSFTWEHTKGFPTSTSPPLLEFLLEMFLERKRKLFVLMKWILKIECWEAGEKQNVPLSFTAAALLSPVSSNYESGEEQPSEKRNFI